MSTILNDRDVLLQATSPRSTGGPPASLIVDADAQIFKVTAGVGSPTVINLSAKLVNMTGTVAWSVSGATGVTPSGNLATLAYSAMTATLATVTAQLTYNGTLYIATRVITKVTDGSNGSNGSPGSNGVRGTVQIVGPGYSSWSDSAANSEVASATGTGPINRDIVTLTNGSFVQTKFYNNGSWLVLTAYFDGNLLVNGTLSASQVSAGVLSGSTISGGSININGGQFAVSGSGGVTAYNFFGYNSQFGNLANPGLPALDATGTSFAAIETGRFTSTSSNSSAHGVRGKNTSFGTSGLVGMAGSYDFYADGSGTNYGPFTGAHDALITNGSDLEMGDLVVDVECVGQRGWSNSIFTVERSSVPNQRGARGVAVVVVGPLSEHSPAAMVEGRSETVDADGRNVTHDIMSGAYYDLADTHTLIAMNGVGEGLLKVCGEGGPIGPDDLLVTSSTPGVAMRQADDLVRGHTVAKARVGRGQTVTFEADEVKVLPCIYLGG